MNLVLNGIPARRVRPHANDEADVLPHVFRREPQNSVSKRITAAWRRALRDVVEHKTVASTRFG